MNFWYQYNAKVGDVIHHPPETDRIRASDFVPFPHSEPFFSGDMLQPPLKKYKKGIIINGERPGTRWRSGDEIEDWNKQFEENEGFLAWDGRPRGVTAEEKKERQLSQQLREVLRPDLLREDKKKVKKKEEEQEKAKSSTDVRTVLENLQPGQVPLVMEQNIPAPVTAKRAEDATDADVPAMRLASLQRKLPSTSSDVIAAPPMPTTSKRGFPLYTLPQMRNINSNKDKLPSVREIESIANDVIVPLQTNHSVTAITSTRYLLAALEDLVPKADQLPEPDAINNFCHSNVYDPYGTTQYLFELTTKMFSKETQVYDPVSIFLNSDSSFIDVSRGDRQVVELSVKCSDWYGDYFVNDQRTISDEGRRHILKVAIASRVFWQIPVDLDAEYRLTGVEGENAIQYILNPEHTEVHKFHDIWFYFTGRIQATYKAMPAREVISPNLLADIETFDVSKLRNICETGPKYVNAGGKASYGYSYDITDWNVNLNSFLIGAYYLDADETPCFRFTPRDVIVWFNYLVNQITKARSISTQGANDAIITPPQKQERTKHTLAHEERQNETRRKVNQARSTQALQRAREQLTAENTYRKTPL